MVKLRSVARVVLARDTSDGAGVKLRRSLGGPELDAADPFLLLDEFRSESGDDYVAGFPDHPHRGFETVTYMLAGVMRHEDHSGNRGELVPGSVQWMTAGRGIIHSEMPQQRDGLLWGFQLWVNLPAKDKMTAPRYQEFAPDKIPVVKRADGATVRVVAGESEGVRGAVVGIATRPLYLDVSLPAGRSFEQATPQAHTGLVYVFEGEGEVGVGDASAGKQMTSGQLGVLSDGEALRVVARERSLRFLLLAAQPLHEPVVRYGPFVMNTREEIHQAIRDFRSGALGG